MSSNSNISGCVRFSHQSATLEERQNNRSIARERKNQAQGCCYCCCEWLQWRREEKGKCSLVFLWLRFHLVKHLLGSNQRWTRSHTTTTKREWCRQWLKFSRWKEILLGEVYRVSFPIELMMMNEYVSYQWRWTRGRDLKGEEDMSTDRWTTVHMHQSMNDSHVERCSYCLK